MATMRMPVQQKRGPVTITVVEGKIALFTVGDRQVRFFIHGDTLSHWASGYKVGSLNPVKVRNLCHYGHHARMTDREAAKQLLADVLGRFTAAELLAKFDAMPVLNSKELERT